MSNLETIADAKIQAALERRFAALTSEIGAVMQEMNARGLIHSSITVQKIHNECMSLFDKTLEDVKAEYSVVLDETLLLTDSLTSRLMLRTREHFEKIAERARNEIKQASQSLVNSGIIKSFFEDIPLARDRAFTDLSLFIGGHKKVKSNRLVKTGIRFVPKLILRFFGFKKIR